MTALLFALQSLFALFGANSLAADLGSNMDQEGELGSTMDPNG